MSEMKNQCISQFFISDTLVDEHTLILLLTTIIPRHYSLAVASKPRSVKVIWHACASECSFLAVNMIGETCDT